MLVTLDLDVFEGERVNGRALWVEFQGWQLHWFTGDL